MINLPSQPKIVKKEGNKAVFEIEALYPGYGVTVGNALRRVMLSSLTGAAATQVKIKGASHEFTTVPGILEDVVFLMLNLKQLRFKLFTDEPQKVRLLVKGEKKVIGKDLELPSQVELVNKDCHIATLTSKTAELDMELTVEKGIGFSARETRHKEKQEIGSVALDALFSPVKRVSYRIENMRVGDRTDYDRLFLDVETDGVISPEEAFVKSSEILLDHFNLLKDSFAAEVAEQAVVESAPEKKAKKASAKKETKKKKK